MMEGMEGMPAILRRPVRARFLIPDESPRVTPASAKTETLGERAAALSAGHDPDLLLPGPAAVCVATRDGHDDRGGRRARRLVRPVAGARRRRCGRDARRGR